MKTATLEANGKRTNHQMHWDAIGVDAASGDLARREQIVELAFKLRQST